MLQLSPDDRSAIVANVVRYLLIADQKKIPIKRADIVKNSIPKELSRAFNVLMKEACDKLRNVFGIQVIHDDKGYILVNTIDNFYNDPHQVCRFCGRSIGVGLVEAITLTLLGS